MGLNSTLKFCLLLTLTLVSHANLLHDDRTARMPWKGEQEDGRKGLRQDRSISSEGNLECQEGDPPGASYSGRRNVTASGRTCQVWAASQPHQHNFTEVGEHSHCRNPNGDSEGVWCFTTDPDKEWEYCSVPICGPTMLKVLDFSADNDHQTDSNGEYTMATLDVGTLPESFTICSSIMVNAWTTTTKSAFIFFFVTGLT